MKVKHTILGTMAYTFVTFPLAILWHVALFKEQYLGFRYFEGEPSFLLGFITILLQGVVLSALFPLVKLNGSAILRGLKFVAIIGPFFWSSHVLAFVAKQAVENAPLFIAMETGYLAAQFGIFGIAIGFVYREK